MWLSEIFDKQWQTFDIVGGCRSRHRDEHVIIDDQLCLQNLIFSDHIHIQFIMMHYIDDTDPDMIQPDDNVLSFTRCGLEFILTRLNQYKAITIIALDLIDCGLNTNSLLELAQYYIMRGILIKSNKDRTGVDVNLDLVLLLESPRRCPVEISNYHGDAEWLRTHYQEYVRVYPDGVVMIYNYPRL